MVTDVNAEQPLNAYFSIAVTESPMTTDVITVLPLNASAEMVLTEFGMIMFFSLPL